MARPSKFNKEVAEEFLESVIQGDSLRTIASKPSMPDLTTLMRWLSKDEGFRQQYTCAKKLQVELKIDGISDIASTATPETIQCVKLQVDVAKWEASKLVPKKYGDKLDLNHSGTMEVTKITRNVIE